MNNYRISCDGAWEMGIKHPFAYLHSRRLETDNSVVVSNKYRFMKIPHGELVTVLNMDGIYALIQYNNVMGYMVKSYLKREPIKRKLNKQLIRYFPTDKFFVIFNQQTGFQLRSELPNGEEPQYSTLPELLDMTITHKCLKGCPYCYMRASTKGKHASLRNIEKIFQQLEHKVFSTALGGGEPTLHPYFEQILQLAEKYDIVPNFSTGIIPTRQIAEIAAKYCGAVAMSYHGNIRETLTGIQQYYYAGVEQVNVHIVLNTCSNAELRILLTQLEYLQKYNVPVSAVVFLRYKPVGRGATFRDENIYSNWAMFHKIIDGDHNYSFNIGVDSCLAPIIKAHHPNIPSETYDFCEAGAFSFYINAVNMTASECSFDQFPGFNLKKIPVLDAWSKMNKTPPRISHCKLSFWRECGNKTCT